MTIHNLSGDQAGNGGRRARAEVVDYRAHQRTFSSIAAADVGLALGAGLGSLMSGILYGVQPAAAPAIVAALTAIALTTLLASLVPLRHATSVSPASIVRAD